MGFSSAILLSSVVTGAQALNLVTSQRVQDTPAACTCQTWKSVYSNGVHCGSSNEYYFNSMSAEPGTLEEVEDAFEMPFCNLFYKKLSSNACVNMNLGEDIGQWCYVSPDCAQSTRVNSSHPISWKTCDDGDLKLRDYTPVELAAFAKEQDLDLGLLHKLSYPLYTDGLFGDFESFFGLGNASSPELSEEKRQIIQNIVDTGKPTSFDTAADKAPPHRIVMGRTVYTVQAAPMLSLFYGMHPGQWNALKCIANC